MKITTPYYLIDKSKLLRNMKKIAYLRERSGAKVLLALKCFASWSIFGFMYDFMDGTTSSSLFELRLGYEKFGKETHAYSVAWANHEIDAAIHYADKVIFNSISQVRRFQHKTRLIPCGLRLNPEISSSAFHLADPVCPFSRLGEKDPEKVKEVIHHINGFMIHNNCENSNFSLFNKMLDEIEKKFSNLFSMVEWISLGGGIHFTGGNYPLDAFADRLKKFSETYGVTIYLEPGEASISNSTTLEVTVLDSFNNGKNIAIIDSSVEAHMLDLLIYRENARLSLKVGPHETLVCGKSCLAGDIFGIFFLSEKLKIDDRLSIQDAGGYTIVKKNWFNGLAMPAIVIKELDGMIRLIRTFDYKDYMTSLS
ncbi:MAG: carboxynorspermidine decarboxylase [Candidatus Tokpelaia sp. JSC085]|nr:MAG: carboxynorspermidine decarboxylase [Candidatus Tokpelaia sp. JSC085]